jgi:trans-aconitate 2-methyltransferase
MTEWNAGEYSRHSSLQAAVAQEQLGRLTLEGAERVLDIGCGDGKITAEIAARVPHGSVLGVDPSPDMFAFATHPFGPATRPNLRFEVADARRLSYRGEFERVVSFNALHWVPEQGEALRSIRAALVDAGQAVLRFVPEGGRRCLEDVIEDVRQSARWARHFTDFQKPYAHFSPQEYQDLAHQNGFRVLRMGFEDRAWDFQTREAFAAFARATFVAWTRHLPESDWPTFTTEVLDRYRSVAACSPHEANTFKFYQLEVELESA